MTKKTEKTNPEVVTVVWSAYVKYRGERYAVGQRAEIQASDYDELAKLDVIQQ
ncbi:hypothetical protein [Paenibacillus popilliae]|uniref:Heme/copper-type cytochrome/quinol oxidase n=1 Tax=Paenibacillus popilliae ATCC 14706 TaxID=1212764 RepID=M9L9U9_PAEPP|nr:hypothetical protein [Paenibacillus popilliae]GAC42282.1 heme/copper-type cytochrome/quinol oxidase [Paenibacillus popilliae ATCC 14706]